MDEITVHCNSCGLDFTPFVWAFIVCPDCGKAFADTYSQEELNKEYEKLGLNPLDFFSDL
jgi:Zn finger protein HypA/HybF involved in hydrogenase expression